MKKRKLVLMLFICIFSISMNASAQSYHTGVGVRFGGLTSGLTVKHFNSSKTALEGILSVGNKSFIVTGLYEVHVPVDNSNAFKFYYGVGGHLGFFRDGGSYYYNGNRLYTNATVAGIDGVLGLEYKFGTAPISLGVDFKPFIDFFNGSIVYFDGGLSLRYTF
ncbi:MAG: hypothetical protein M0Q26_06590 [Chitinophagaceae bacterium]|nr:hypothetical protein [Chitinophagaceae bacterium]MDP1762672.1 hypothetical protein [Sediminibacterium sp.]MDP1810113.1 hypothetical protein [Sediminibacterium sp.]MDP3127819.1 hypothetical protein [Sediminibacterium sp.]